MTQLFTNNASGTLSVQAEIVDTTLTLQSGEGSLFPSPTGGDFFQCSLEDTSGNLEIVTCTFRNTNDLTVTRAQENTVALVFPTGSRVELRMTAATHDSFIQVYGGQMQGELDLNNEILRDPLLTDGEIRNSPLRGTDGGTGNEIVVPTAGGDPTLGGNTILHTGNASGNYVPENRQVISGEGLTGGGTLAADRTLEFDFLSLNTMNAATLDENDGMVIYDATASEHKVITNQGAGTRIISVTSDRNLDYVDSNALIYGDATNRTLTIQDSIFHVGAEIALVAVAAGTITLAVGGSQSIISLDSNLTISSGGGGAYLAQYVANTWILVGDLE